MSITFRIATDADDRSGPMAKITAPQLGAFQRYLRAQGDRLGIVLLHPDARGDDYLCYHFEARICPLALASVAWVFDHDADVLAVLEEAQFRGRRVMVYRVDADRSIRMRVALTSDQGLELNLANGNAYALLESLGLHPHSVGEIAIADIRARITNPAVKRRGQETGVADYLGRLDRLLQLGNADASSRLEWA
ncbi:hypothetical protein [Sphingobium sp. EM0848]|uniref:hypothetical protein n=1 Tax=Sphingobium sp. EM0848 TaxID=2743473 RepID=UPI00159C0B42|nr:hypothetical protein [Sphingobium sp. EM0848]